MATEYVDAGTALPYATLSTSVGKAPPVTKGLTHERILNAREEPHNWLTYYGAYDGQRYSPLDQINKDNVGKLTPQWVFQAGSMGLHSGASTYAWEASPIVVDGVMYVSGWDGERQGAVALQARVPVRRVAVLRQRQPRRRRGRGIGLHDHPERPRDRAGR
jgi:alcohol dehydrogenase (cytochrome c)